jgi:kynureninase
VRRELQEQLRSPIQGWFGQRDQFAMGPVYDPAPGIERFGVGTPPVLAMAALDVGVRLIAEAGVERLAAKGRAMTSLLIELADAWLAHYGVRLASPRAAERRGSHVTLEHPQAWQLTQALIERGVVPDFRTPDRLRLGPAPLYTRYVDVWDAMDRLRGLVERGEQREVDQTRSRVT